MKKYFLLSLLLGTLISIGHAQEFTQALKADQSVKILLNRSDIKVEGYDGNEVKITATNYEAPPERAKGLRPLYNNAVDNTNTGLAVTEENGALMIREASGQEGEYIIRIPQNAKLSISQQNWNGQDIEVQNMKNEVEIKSNSADVRLLNVDGPVIANSTSGDIEVVFSALNQAAASKISAISSDVEVSLPANSPANFKLKSISGEIYTDFDMDFNQDKEGSNMRRLGGGHTIEASTNGGGAELGIETISSNIYIRKAQ
ncbi:DUF4097 family beta strand repeat-containing protein [Catalinimonas niigatensis]|uniref:DUF4097 family beta strand repeat-containing protein n=1 Tax=Catalinimonas niigatensis TaxID=1397264 RepID=UPI002665F745|nr:DUF4097 family beta strand repeat-containing protein [Catalinimonas niigatensis]WPP53420.1 DUF4097 family beta strand repeat-containing protein [Catalinimonas niigatensis]